jgi:hypothetical protein
MKPIHRSRRRGTTALLIGGAMAFGLLAQAPMAHGAAAPDRAAAAPDCDKNPEQCKVVEEGQTARRNAVNARKGKARCQSWKFERWGKSAVGIKLYSYYLTVRWCSLRGRITEASSNPFPEVHAPLWSFDKHLAHNKRGGKRKKSYRVFAQGQFKFCVTKLGCVQDRQPWISVTARGNGTHSYDTGG